MIRRLIICLLVPVLGSCQGVSSPKKSNEWVLDSLMNGFNFTGTPYRISDYSDFDTIKTLGAHWVSFSPFAYHLPDGQLVDTFAGQWYGERTSGIIESIDSAHAHGLKVLIKPHIWILDGTFTGDLDLDQSPRGAWEDRYTAFLVRYAHICQQHQVEVLSIGNELKTPINNHPAYWSQLIDTLRTIYTGQLTYSANWDNFQTVPFWEKLDLIGINAYFPLSTTQVPTLTELQKKWEPWMDRIRELQTRVQKPVVFTEFGYRATTHCCEQPWDYSHQLSPSFECQSIAYEALMGQYLGEVVSGVFIWKWFHHQDNPRNDLYSPQNRPSLEVVRRFFSK